MPTFQQDVGLLVGLPSNNQGPQKSNTFWGGIDVMPTAGLLNLIGGGFRFPPQLVVKVLSPKHEQRLLKER